MEKKKLSLDEMEEGPGGKIHFEPHKDKPGRIQHGVTENETPIRTGEYLWIKK